LQRRHRSFEVEDFPESDADIQQPNATDRATHPT
jgi:hypothetical protein